MSFKNKKSLAIPFLLSVLLAACGGGGGDTGTGPGPGPLCTASVKSGFTGNLPVDSEGVGEADGGGSEGGADGEGGIGAGGGLGQFRKAIVVFRDPVNGQDIATGETDEVTGMATGSLCSHTGPVEVIFKGQSGATYFDEAKGAFVPFPAGSEVSAMVPDLKRSFIGVTPYTDAASRLTKSLSATLTAATISDSNDKVAAVLADQLPGTYRSGANGGKFTLTGLPIVLNDQNANQTGTIADTNRGRYGAVNAALGSLAGTFLPNDPAPALTIAEQFARDMSDGKLDMVDSQGCSVAEGPAVNGTCPASTGKNIAYTYETMWRAKSVATGLTADAAGDAALAARSASVAVYSLSSKRSYESCAFPADQQCDPLLRVTTAEQTVRLDSKGKLTISRSSTAPFGNQLRFINASTGTITIPGDYVEVKVGTGGDIIALNRARNGFLYIDPLQLYEVTGTEVVENFALRDDQLRLSLVNSLSNRVAIPLSSAATRVTNFAPSPAARIFQDGAAGVAPAFLFILTDGSLNSMKPAQASGNFAARWTSPQQASLPSPEALSTLVYDRFVPPAFDAAYGPTPSGAIALPWNGPRRLYGLTRSGKVKVWLEGATATGQELAVPGVVVQLVAEAKTGVFALNSDGNVFWLNADQAHASSAAEITEQANLAAYPRRYALNHVEPISIGESICWLARNEAVACGSGNAYRWTEDLAELVYTPSTIVSACGPAGDGATTGATRDVVPVSKGISAATRQTFVSSIGPIWRLNSAEEIKFERRGTFRRVCKTEGLRFLGVNGTETDEAGALGLRSIGGTTATFSDGNGGTFQAPYITGLQLRTAFETASAAIGGTAKLQISTGPTGFNGRVLMAANAGQSSFVHTTSVLRVVGTAQVPVTGRPDVSFTGSYTASNGTNTLDITTVQDLSTPRTVSVTGGTYSWADGDNVRLNAGAGEWQLSPDGQAGCTNCIDERGQNRRWQILLLPTNDAENAYGFRVCFRIRTEQTATANIRFVCTKHDNDGNYTGTSMTDRILYEDDAIDLIDFLHF